MRFFSAIIYHYLMRYRSLRINEITIVICCDGCAFISSLLLLFAQSKRTTKCEQMHDCYVSHCIVFRKNIVKVTFK